MSDVYIISSDDDDDFFIDLVFEELGTLVKQENPRVLPQRNPVSPSTKLSKDETPLNNIKKRKTASDFVTSLSVEIPSIFLTEGIKNSRILRQDEEIALQLAEEEHKAQLKITALENEKAKILDELNDNGSNFHYSWKNDSKIIEDYVQKSLSKDLSIINRRQFYFFNNVQTPLLDDSFAPMTPLLSTALNFSSGDPDQFLRMLHASHISLSAFIVAGLRSVLDLPSLACIEKIVRRDYEKQKIKQSDETYLNEHIQSPKESLEKVPSFTQLMEAIGARPLEISECLPVKLKLVHYNNHTSLLLLRLSILFHYYLPRAKTKDEFILLFQYFYLSCSDFHVNKIEKSNLRKNFIGPIFQIFVDECLRKFGAKLFIDEAHKILSLIKPSIYGQEEVQSQKALEIHFNMLLNLLYLVSPQDQAFAFVKELMFMFLEIKIPASDLVHVVKIIKEMCRLSLMTKLDTIFNHKISIYKNFYKAHLISVIITFSVLDEAHQNSQELLKCQQELLVCKDVYQLVIGHLSFLGVENTREKSRISLVLSDTYHMLDYMVNVLTKSGVLPDRDFFYDK